MEGSLVAYKVFTNGSTLQASEVNENLMQQSVATFSNQTARDAAITSPVEGQVTYIEDSNSYQSYDGFSWVGLISKSGNAIINGGFDIWQRGTSGFSLGGAFNADRWNFYTGTPTNKSITRQPFTPNELNVDSFGDANFYWRYAETVATVSDTNLLTNKIENVSSFANQIVTISFYAKSSNPSSIFRIGLTQNFGSGGSSSVITIAATRTLSTSWTRYTETITLPSILGKTVGANSFLQLGLTFGTNLIQTLDVWGVQLEAGPVATPFRRNANSLQGELAACQRYYFRNNASLSFSNFGLGQSESTTVVVAQIPVPVSMRVPPTSVDFSNVAVIRGGSPVVVSALVVSGNQNGAFLPVLSATSTGLTSGVGYRLAASNNASAFIGLSAEL
jgi:hypothetical protein